MICIISIITIFTQAALKTLKEVKETKRSDIKTVANGDRKQLGKKTPEIILLIIE